MHLQHRWRGRPARPRTLEDTWPYPCKHRRPPPPPHVTAKVEKVNRPVLVTESTSEDWNYFLTRWADYEEATGMTGKALILQLLECYDEKLRRDLTRTAGGSLTNKSKGDVLALMKKLAIRAENPMVTRAELHTMRQDHDEPVRAFSARVRGQADTPYHAQTAAPTWTTLNPCLFVCEIFIEGFKLLQWLALLSKQALSHTYYIYEGIEHDIYRYTRLIIIQKKTKNS